MRKFYQLLIPGILAALLIWCNPTESNAQFRNGAWGLSAAMSMPNGLVPGPGVSPTITLPVNTGGQVAFNFVGTSGINYVAGDNLQLELGIGYLSVSADVPGDNDPDPLSSIAVALGGKYFLSNGPVMPYLGLNGSYAILPTTKFNTTEITGNVMSLIAYFGAMSFINDSKTLAIFLQMGLGYNSGTVTTETNGSKSDASSGSFNLGGSAIGAAIYF